MGETHPEPRQLSESVSLVMRDGVGLVVVDNPPVSALSEHVRVGLDAAPSPNRRNPVHLKSLSFVPGFLVSQPETT